MAGYNTKELLKNTADVTVGASQTASVVGTTFRISEKDSREMLMQITVDNSTVAAGITALFQHSYDGGITWASADTQAITADQNETLSFSYVAGTNNALGPIGRLAITTGAGDTVDITAAWITVRS